MVNEWMDRFVDGLVEGAPRWWRRKTSVYKQPGPVHWHILHITRCFSRSAAALWARVSKPVDQQDPEEKPEIDFRILIDSVLERVNERFRRLELPGAFALVLYALMMAVSLGTGSTAVAAAATLLLWASRVIINMDPGGRFYFASLGQVYIISVILRLFALLGMMVYFLKRYAGILLLSNVLLQGMILMTTVIHLVLFFVLIFPGCRRNPMLVAMSFVQGFGGALMFASAVCAATSSIRGGLTAAAGGVLAAIGAGMVYLGDRMLDFIEIGGIHLHFPYLWKTLLFIGGWLIMLVGMWLGA